MENLLIIILISTITLILGIIAGVLIILIGLASNSYGFIHKSEIQEFNKFKKHKPGE